MSPEELNRMLSRDPFVPLRIHVAEKTTYDIRNPNMAMVGRTILFIGLRRDIVSPLFDEPVLIAVPHITRVEPIVEPAAA